jgi:putative intracellular protease/amidase
MKVALSILVIFIGFLSAITKAETKTNNVGILVFPGVEIIDFAGPYEVFGWAGYNISTISTDGKPLTTAMNLQIIPSNSFANAPKLDILVVPGGEIKNILKNQDVTNWIKANAASVRILSVCNGAYIVAETGLLDGMSATTFFPAIDDFRKKYPKVTTFSDRRLVDNGNIVTAGGLSSGIDAALHMLAKEKNIETARSVATSLEYPWHPDNGYVRGKMADTELKSISGYLPKDLQFEDIYSYGNETEWFAAYKVSASSSLNPKDLNKKDVNKNYINIKYIEKKLAKSLIDTAEWTQQSSGFWEKPSASGKKWVLHLSVEEESKEFMLKLHLRVSDLSH